MKHASFAFASTSATQARLQKLGCNHTEILTQIGISKDELEQYTAKKNGGSCTFISIGVLSHLKGFQLGLKAFAQVLADKSTNTDMQYIIVGDGPFRSHLEKLAKDLHISDKVQFLGSLPRAEVLNQLQTSDALVFPSFHDSAGLVVLEAMATENPVICLNTGGPPTLIDETCGFAATVESEEAAIIDIANAMTKLANNTELRKQMGIAGRKRVETHYLWEEKAKRFSVLYYSLVEK